MLAPGSPYHMNVLVVLMNQSEEELRFVTNKANTVRVPIFIYTAHGQWPHLSPTHYQSTDRLKCTQQLNIMARALVQNDNCYLEQFHRGFENEFRPYFLILTLNSIFCFKANIFAMSYLHDIFAAWKVAFRSMGLRRAAVIFWIAFIN